MHTANAIRIAVFALCGCLFALVGLVSLIVYGNDMTRFYAIVACLFACFSQFVGQDPRRFARRMSIVFAYCAFAAVIVALVFFIKR